MIKCPIKRFISDEDMQPAYADLVSLKRIFNHPVIEDSEGIWRWHPNYLTAYLKEPRGFKSVWGGSSYAIDLNGLMLALHRKEFSLEEYMKFQMDNGYSLCGFCEIFGQRTDYASGLTWLELVAHNHAKPKNRGKHWMEISTEWSNGPE